MPLYPVANVPVLHGVHVDALYKEYVPGVHEEHVEIDVAARAVLYEPAVHPTHSVAAIADVKYPDGQDIQLVAYVLAHMVA
jgi:hypothetical protein